MSIKTKTLVGLVMIGLIDMVIPVPILGIVLFYVVLQKPPWFPEMVSEIYKS
ncbi:MAG: hypothetical protein JRH12_02035 [Deltaproteobacteria bacterium]|jgi:hypothetical protein|nr:hypothetical protein [Deltaproteobacteria bacterium]MBW2478393.1 hypothetical protein [Deltaproteobacteria bacterium]